MRDRAKELMNNNAEEKEEVRLAYVCAINRRQDNMHEKVNALWIVSEDDARRICSDPRTIGPDHMLVYFLEHDEMEHFTFIKDDGRYKTLLDDLNIVDFRNFE